MPYNLKIYSKITIKNKKCCCSVKDLRKQKAKKNVPYKLNCKHCEALYIGENGRAVKQRMNEHKLAVKKRDEKSHKYI